jgi:hypothetical protein
MGFARVKSDEMRESRVKQNEVIEHCTPCLFMVFALPLNSIVICSYALLRFLP